MKHIVCFSGGHSSALAAIETVRRYGQEGVVLLNHDISPPMLNMRTSNALSVKLLTILVCP